MTPEQAVQVLEQMRLQCNMSGANHEAAKEAIRVLTELVAHQGTETPES